VVALLQLRQYAIHKHVKQQLFQLLAEEKQLNLKPINAMKIKKLNVKELMELRGGFAATEAICNTIAC
jgi:hypothetical protein